MNGICKKSPSIMSCIRSYVIQSAVVSTIFFHPLTQPYFITAPKYAPPLGLHLCLCVDDVVALCEYIDMLTFMLKVNVITRRICPFFSKPCSLCNFWPSCHPNHIPASTTMIVWSCRLLFLYILLKVINHENLFHWWILRLLLFS